MDYIRLGAVVALGVIVYAVALTVYTPGTANFFGLIYALLALRVYQGLGIFKSQSPSVTE